jgi:hypothetical protein
MLDTAIVCVDAYGPPVMASRQHVARRPPDKVGKVMGEAVVALYSEKDADERAGGDCGSRH